MGQRGGDVTHYNKESPSSQSPESSVQTCMGPFCLLCSNIFPPVSQLIHLNASGLGVNLHTVGPLRSLKLSFNRPSFSVCWLCLVQQGTCKQPPKAMFAINIYQLSCVKDSSAGHRMPGPDSSLHHHLVSSLILVSL